MKKLLLLVTLVVFYNTVFGQNRGVGIGVNPPTEKLHVVGNFRLQGAFMPNNQAGTAGQILQSQGTGLPPVWINAPQGGGGGYRPRGTVNYVAHWTPNDSTLGTGLTQDNGTQTLIRSTAGLPYTNLNYLSIIEATNTGQNVLNTQRAALRAISQDTIAILGLSFTVNARGPAVRGQSNGIAGGVSGVNGTTGLGSNAICYGVWGSNSAAGTFSPIFLNGKSFLAPAGTYGNAGIVDINSLTTDIGHGVQGVTFSDSTFAAGVYGENHPLGIIFNGGTVSAFQTGVMGYSGVTNITGTIGMSDSYDDQNGVVEGVGRGVFGIATGGSGIGVMGTAYNFSTGLNMAGPNYGVWGDAWATEANAAGVRGRVFKTQTGQTTFDGAGVNGPGFGVWGESYQENDFAAGVKGVSYAQSGGYGVFGESQARVGVYGLHSNTTGVEAGVLGVTNNTTDRGGAGVRGLSSDGETYGVHGETQSAVAYASGVYGVASSTSGVVNGVTGITNSESDDAAGVYGIATGEGNQTTYGVFGETNSLLGGIGVLGRAAKSNGSAGIGIKGESESGTGVGYGVAGTIKSADAAAAGVYGDDNNPGSARSTSHAGWFDGHVQITDGLDASGTKNFMIDHPLAPSQKYLRHACLESNEVLNVYSGNITTDVNGVATVVLPDYFQTLNIDYRYQLTTIGQFSNVIISKKLENNRFEIKTDKPSVEVSWQITGKRNDAYMQKYPFVAEQVKEPENQGKYLTPHLYGEHYTKGIGFSSTLHQSGNKPTPSVVKIQYPKMPVVDPKTGNTPSSTDINVSQTNEEFVRIMRKRHANQTGKMTPEEMKKRIDMFHTKPITE